MADDTPKLMKTKEITQKRKKKNFTDSEMNMIQNMVEKNYKLLNEKVNNNNTNAKKQEMWKQICDRVNSIGVEIRTPKEIRDKWANTKKEAKKVFTAQRKEMTKTGGGPPPQPLNVCISRTIDLCKDSVSFKGISGFETNITDVNGEYSCQNGLHFNYPNEIKPF